MSTAPKPFKLDTKTIFLTIPRTNISKEIAYDRLLEKYRDRLNCFIISQEFHKDEGTHLHCYINFKDRFQTKAQNIFDFIGDKHPNIQSARNPNDVIKYVIKDGNYITYNIDVEKHLDDVKEHKVNKNKGQFYKLSIDIKESIKNNQISLKSLNEKYGELFIKYGEHIKKYIKFCEDMENKEEIDKYYDNYFKNINFNEFQNYILSLIDNKVDDRKIHWFYDEKGNSGKSTIGNYLQLYKDAYIITGGKHADIYRHYNNNKVVIYDLPRDYMNSNESLYATMETFKNGYCLDTKYEGTIKRFIPPHIIVFSNSKPDFNKLSKDRWNIVELDSGKIMKHKEDINEELMESLNNPERQFIQIPEKMHIEESEKIVKDIIKEDIKILLKSPKIHKKVYLDRYEYNERLGKYYDIKLNNWFECLEDTY